MKKPGCEYKIIPVNIGKGEQFKAEFLAVSPNNRIPAIVDHDPPDGGKPISVFESGAILFYLADKTGKFIGKDIREPDANARMAVLADGRTRPNGWAEQSFQQLRGREVAVRDGPLSQRGEPALRRHGQNDLADRPYLAGDYSIADMACYPWIVPWERQGQKLSDFPNLQRWFEAIKARPAVVKAYEWTPKINPGQGGIRTAEERAILFGQTAASVKTAAEGAGAR